MRTYVLIATKTIIAVSISLMVVAGSTLQAQPGTVISHQKISDTEGGFTGTLDDDDIFGWSMDGIGDLDGDGAQDIVVGTWSDDDGGFASGAVWVLFLNTDGTVKSHQKISATEGGFTGTVTTSDLFGKGVTGVGDLDGDGTQDIAVGAPGDDDGGSDKGAVWVLFLNTDGTVKSHQKISATEGGFTGGLNAFAQFGNSVAALGDLDGDGIQDIAVGNWFDYDDDDYERGSVWVLFLNTDGTVKSHQKITEGIGGFTGTLDSEDHFGWSVAAVEDLDGDGAPDMAVGVIGDDSGGFDRGAVWVLFLNVDGSVRSNRKISDTAGAFAGTLDDADQFGYSLAGLGDLDGDGIQDIAVGASQDDDGGGFNRGAVWVLFLNTDGTVKSHQKISDTEGGFTGSLFDFDYFGTSVAAVGDLNGDGVEDIAVGARGDDDGGEDRGAVWLLLLNPVPDLEVTCSPVSPPIDIPAGGGSYVYDIEIVNNGATEVTFDIWIDINGPGVNRTKGPVTRILAPSASFSRTLNQNVPGGVPAGEYTHTCNVGAFPVAAAGSSFGWTKSSSLLSSDVVVASWSTDAEFEAQLEGAANAVVDIPGTHVLEAAYPNPFNPEATFRFAVNAQQHARADLVDVSGRVVATLFEGNVAAGVMQTIRIDGAGLPSGTYVVRLTGETFSDALTVTLLK